MPEGPEVKILVNVLKKRYTNDILENIEVISGKYMKKKSKATRIDNLEKFKKALPLKILSINCKGKFIYFEFENNWFLFMCLALNGRIVKRSHKHNRVKFITNKNIFYFKDMRNFGVLNFYNGKKLVEKKLNSLGVDLLSTDLSNEDIVKFIKSKIKKMRNENELIGDKLLDQKIFCGVGNYIRADALYLAKISPFSKIKDLNNEQLLKLVKCIRIVMKNSYKIQKKCLKFKTYEYEKIAHCYKPLVYFQKKTKNGEEVIHEKMKFQKRTMWWVPESQILI